MTIRSFLVAYSDTRHSKVNKRYYGLLGRVLYSLVISSKIINAKPIAMKANFGKPLSECWWLWEVRWPTWWWWWCLWLLSTSKNVTYSIVPAARPWRMYTNDISSSDDDPVSVAIHVIRVPITPPANKSVKKLLGVVHLECSTHNRDFRTRLNKRSITTSNNE